MASEYDRKFEEMKNYIPFLESMIKRLESTSGSSNPRQAQLDKIRSLRDLLLDKKKRMKMENLLKCEQVLVNLYAKVEQRDTLPGIDLKTPSNPVKVKDEPDLDLVRNKLKIVTKMQEESPGTLPEIARANETRDTSTAGAKEPALFQRRPNLMGSSSSCTPTKSLDTKNPQPKRNYTRVLVSPEPSPQRWSKHDDTPEKPLFSRRSPRRQSPTYHRKDRKHSKQDNSPKSKDLNNLNITLKVPEERLDSLNTSDIFSRIIHCSDSDVDITTLRELRSQILGELKHTGAKDDISDLILNSSKRKKKKKSHKRKEEIEEGELSDSESEAIENIYGSLVIVEKDQNTTESKVSNKHDQKPRKIQIRLVINSENEAGSSDSPSTSDKKGMVSDISDVSELEMFDKDLEPRSSNKEVTKLQIESKEKQSKLDVTKSSEFDIAPKASQLPDELAPKVSELAPKALNFSDEIAPKASELSDVIAPKASELPVKGNLQKTKEAFLEKNETNNSNEFIPRNEGTLIEINKKQEDKNSNDMTPYKPNFYKPLTVQETDSKDNKADENVDAKDTAKNSQNVAGLSSDKKDSTIEETVSSNNDKNVDMPNKVSENVEIPLLNEPSVASHKPKESVVSDIDILQALKNEILSETIAIPGTDAVTPALHQPKLTKVKNAQEIAPKKRISIENYKKKATPKPATKPLFTSQLSKDKDDQNKKQSLKLTEKECERFKIALANDLSSDDDDIYDDLNKSGDDDMDLAPKSPDIDDSSTVGNNIPVIIPVDPVKDTIASSKADVDMRTLMPILSPLATPSPPVKEVSSQKSVIDTKQIISKPEKNRPCDPRLKRDMAPSIMPNEPPKPVPPPLLPFPNVTATMPIGIVPSLIPTLTPSPNMTPTMTPIINPGMTPNRIPNMTPVRAPNMTPSMTPNSRTFEIDDQPKRKHVYASLCDLVDNNDDIQRPYWEKPDNTNSHEPRWEPIDDRDRNQHSSMQATQDGQKYNRYSDSRSFYNNYNKPDGRDDPQVQLYRRTDAPMTPSHPFGRSDCPPTPSHSFGRSECPPTPSHPFGRSECPPTPSHPFGRSECPPTPSHPFGRLDCPPTPNHPFGRSEGPTLSHSYSRSECPMTPSHPFGRSECPPTPNHSFGRSECPMTPTHSFGRSDVPVTSSHPFGRMDRDPRLQKGYDYDNNVQNDDRNRRYYNEQALYKPYNPKHDLNSKSYNDNYRNHREQSTGRSDRNRPDYYKEQSGRNYNDDRMSRHEQSGNRSRNFDGDQYNSRGQKTDNDYYPTRFREVESRPNYQREKSVGLINSSEDRHVRSNSRARSVGRNNERDDENTLSVKPHGGRSFTIDTSVNSTFQDVVKGQQEKSIFDQLFDRRKRASSVGRTFVRETSVGRTLSRPSMDHSGSTNDRFRRARSVVKDTESKSFSEVKADFESYRSKTNTSSNRNSNAMQTKTAIDRNSPRLSKANNIPSSKISESKQTYSPRKNYRDPRLNRDPRHHDPRVRQKDDKYRYDARDKKNHGIIYSNDNIASGTILGSGYGVKNYKIPKIKRPEEPVSIEKSDTSKSVIVEKDKKPDGNIETKNKNKDLNIKNKNKEKESDFKNKRKEKDSDKNKEKESDKNRNKEKESDANNKIKEKESDANNKRKEKESDNANNKFKAKEFKTLEKESKPTNNVKSYVDNSDKRLKRSSRINENEDSNILDEVIARPRRTRLQIRESESEDNTNTVPKDVIPKVQSPKKHPIISKDKKEGRNDSLDDSFGIDDLEIFSENAVSEPVIDSIDSLIADLDEDLNASRNEGASKFTNEISLENMLENITCQSATEVTNDISIDTTLEDINKLIGNDESENSNKTEVSNAFPTLEKSPEQKNKVQTKTQTKVTDNVKLSVDEDKSGDVENKVEKNKDLKMNKPQSAANEQIPVKEADDIVSTTENVINEIKADDKKEINEQIERSTTPDSTNTDSVPKESIRVDSLPDSTDEVHSEVSEVSSSNTSAQISLKEPEPSSLKEASSASDPLGNILSILQSKSKIKELLSMLGDQSSDNDKIKKKLEKLSEIVSDDEDTRDDAEQESAIGVDQESRDDTEIESKDNEDEESRDCTDQDKPKENQIETDNKALKDDADKVEVPSLDNSEQKQDEMSSVDNSMENDDELIDEPENTTAAKKKNIVKKIPMKRRNQKGKILRNPLITEDKRVTRSVVTVKKSAPVRKKKSELLKLQEDIKEMFISDDVLNVTGIRMCRLAKLVDDNGQKDVSAKSDTEPVVVLEKFNKNESLYETPIEGKATKTKLGLSIKKKPGPKSKVKVTLNESSGDSEEKVEKPKTKSKNKPGPKSKTKSKIQRDVDPYEFETDSVNESNASKISEGSIRDSSEVSDSESLTSLTSFGSSEALSELKTLAELKKKPKRKRSSWKAGVIKPKKKKKPDLKTIESASKNQATDEKQCIAIPDFNCFTDKKYCYVKNVLSYSCRLCVYNGEEIVAHYKKEHPHTEIPLSRLSPEVAKEAIEQCEEINFQAISKIPTDKYVCRFCYKEFGKKKAALETFFWHVVSMHTGEYKQICSECVNITRCPFNLDIPPPPKDIKGQLIGYICGKCNFTQISLENLKTHVIVRHNDEQTEVYTINLAVMSRKIINLLSKRVSLPETDKPRVLRSSRSNQSMTEMSDDRSDATETNSCFTDPETLKDEIQHKGVKEIRKLSLESKSKLQSKITFENDDSASDTNLAPVKIEKEDLDEEDREELINAVEPRDNESSTVKNQRGTPGSDNSATQPHFKVNYTDTGTGIELMCFINSSDSHYKCSALRSFRTHVHSKHKEERWDGYCYICEDFVHDKGKYFFKDCLTHFQIKHMDSEMVSEVYFRINYSETGLRQYLCFIDGHDHYQCPSLISLKLHVGSHKGKWNGHCFDCKEFVKPKGEYFIEECLSHYLLKHQLDGSPPDASAIAREIVASCQLNQLCTEATSSEENKQPENPVSDIFAHPHFKVSYTDTGSKEFVCCINLKDEIHYKTSLLISFKRHVQTKHSENWDGYCFVCKVIVMPQGRHLFKDCLQHFVDKHMDDFPVLEKLPEPEKPEEEATSSPRPYINVRPLSQLKDIDTEEDRGLVLPKIESVVSLGTTSAPEVDFSAPSETELTEPPPADQEPEAQIEEFHNYEASQVKVMSQKHAVVQEAMLRKEKLVKVFKCAGSFCSFATDSADMALSHALTHQKIGGENALCCSYCDFDCSGNAIDLVVHVFKHASCPYSCGYCFYRAAAAQLVVAHSNTAHSGKSVKVFIANKATLPEKDTSQMLSREDVVLYYVCKNEDTLCKFKTYTARKFCDHLQTRHPCSEHSCYICSQKMATATDLIQHMKSHDLNLYQCTWCIHGADSEPELLGHAAARHPTHQPQAYLRIITNKDGSSEMRVLPLASFNKTSVGVEHVVSSTLPENPVKEAERSIDLQKLIGQTKLLYETMTSTDTPSKPSVAPTAARRISNADDMATISPTVSVPPNKIPPRLPTPQPDIAEQTTPVLKSEPAEITPSKVSNIHVNDIVCLDSDEEDQPDAPQAFQRSVENVIDISEEDANKSAEIAAAILPDDKVFKCPKCLHCCKTDTGLKLHILKCYNPNWPMACPHCHKMTDNREALIQHYISDHCKKYVCGVCTRETHSLKAAKIHFKLLHKVTKVHVEYGVGDKPHIVTKDKPPVPTRVAPKRKLSMTSVPAPPPKQIKRYGPQDVDQLPINPILDDLVYCALCEFNTKVRLNLVRHLQRHAESEPVPETAPVNPVPHLETNEMHFDKMVNLASSSLAKDKPKEVGPIVSQIPPEAAARYPKYIPERQRYTCGAKDCSYISVDEGMLRCHWETLHSEMVDYRCVHCPPYQHLDKSKPLTAARIMMHLKMHDTSLYACSSCTYYHFRRQFVEKHITDLHKGIGQLMVVREEATGPVVPTAAGAAPTMDLKPWQCGLCSFKSMLRAEVVEHCSKNHQSKMQFKCSYCPFRTSTLENVVKHQTNSHPGRPEEIFYYYYREGSVTEEDGNPTWMKQRQKMGITDDPVVKTEVSEGVSSKPDPPMSVAAPVAASVALDLNIVKKEVEEENAQSVEELCVKFGQFCEPNGLKYKCPLCTVVTEDSREAIQSHLYEELQYRRWRCSICSYKAFHRNGLHEHISTEHRGRMQEPLPINLPADVNIERWVAELLRHQTAIIEKNKQNLLGQKVQTAGPTGALNAPQKVPEKPVEIAPKTKYAPKELEDAFGQFGVANSKEYCCPKCVFRSEREEVMREHLESELTKIRWCCSACPNTFQNYHEAQFHCKTHEGQSARPKEAIRDPYMRAAWVTTAIQTQKRTITENSHPINKPLDSLLKPIETNINPSESLLVEKDMLNLVGQRVQRPTKVTTPEKEETQSEYQPKELEDAFGQFGVANNMEFCCPKCVYRANKEEAMRDHLEMELTKIRWSCNLCPNNFQTYHQAQFHCKSHTGMAARPKEAIRDPNMRLAWVNAVIQVQKTGMKAATNENTFSNKSQEPEDSLLVVRYEEKVPMPEQSSRPAPEPTPESPTSRPETPESDEEKLVIDEIFAPKRIGKVTVCPHCNYQSKHAVVVRDHVYRHYGLYPYACSYCEFSGYRATVSTHLDSVHPHELKKIKAVPLPKGPPTVANLQKRMRRKTSVNDWRFCMQCHVSVNIEQACAHTHGNQPGVLAKHGDVVVNCKVCQTFRKDFDFMNEHFAAEHPGRAMNFFIYQILYNAGSSEPVFKKLPNMPSETIDIDDGSPPQRKVARKSTTKLPMQMVAKKSTTKLPLLYVSEEDEFSYYGTKPTPIDAFENVTTLMPFNNTLMPFSVKKLSEIIKINPRVVVKDAKK